jgi:hypothetical protein
MFGSRLMERPSLRTLGTIVIGTAVVATGMVTTAPSASAATNATVTLTVNGVTTKVTTSASNVGELLTEQDVPYDGTDIVTPAKDTAISNGMAVSWTPAIRVIVKDGTERTAHRVTAVRAQRVATELQLPTGVETTYTKLQAYSYEEGRIYAPGGRRLTGDDRVAEDSTAIVHRVRFTFPDDRVTIQKTVVRDKSKLVRDGSTRIYKDGRNGKRYVVYRKKFLDGNLVSRTIETSRVLREAQRRVVRVGTGPNWIGLARCESGLNPNAYNPAGFYGLYQFSLSTWRAVGGTGLPTDYGYWEQTKRAWILFQASGRSPWPTCGSRL